MHPRRLLSILLPYLLPSIMETFKSLYARCSPLVFKLQMFDLIAHGVQFLQLVLPVLLLLKVLQFVCLGQLIVLAVLECLGHIGGVLVGLAFA